MEESGPEITKEIMLNITEEEYIDVLDKLNNELRPLKLYKNTMLKNIHQLKLTSLSKNGVDLQAINFLVSKSKQLITDIQALRIKHEKAFETSEKYMAENRDLQISLEALELKFAKYKEDESQKFASLKKQYEEANQKLITELEDTKSNLNDSKRKVDSLFKGRFECDQKIALLTAEKQELQELIEKQNMEIHDIKMSINHATKKIKDQYYHCHIENQYEKSDIKEQNEKHKLCINDSLQPERLQVCDNQNFGSYDVNISDSKEILIDTNLHSAPNDQITNDKESSKGSFQKDTPNIIDSNDKELEFGKKWIGSRSSKFLRLIDLKSGFLIIEYLDNESISILQKVNKLFHFSLSLDKRIIQLLHRRSVKDLQNKNKELQSKLDAFKIEASKYSSSLKRFYIYKLLYRGEIPSFIDEFEGRFISLMDKLLSFEKPYRTPPSDDNGKTSFFARLKNRIPQLSKHDLVM